MNQAIGIVDGTELVDKIHCAQTNWITKKAKKLQNIQSGGPLCDQRETDFRKTMKEIAQGYPQVTNLKKMLRREEMFKHKDMDRK